MAGCRWVVLDWYTLRVAQAHTGRASVICHDRIVDWHHTLNGSSNAFLYRRHLTTLCTCCVGVGCCRAWCHPHSLPALPPAARTAARPGGGYQGEQHPASRVGRHKAQAAGDWGGSTTLIHVQHNLKSTSTGTRCKLGGLRAALSCPAPFAPAVCSLLDCQHRTTCACSSPMLSSCCANCPSLPPTGDPHWACLKQAGGV